MDVGVFAMTAVFGWRAAGHSGRFVVVAMLMRDYGLVVAVGQHDLANTVTAGLVVRVRRRRRHNAKMGHSDCQHAYQESTQSHHRLKTSAHPVTKY